MYSQYISVVGGTNPACIGSSVSLGAFLNATTPASVRWEKMPQGTIISSSSTQINVQVTSANQQYRALGGNFSGNVVYITIYGQTTPSAFATNIQGPSVVCNGQGLSYTEPENVNTNLWIWTYPFGFTGPASTNTPTNDAVNCGVNAVSGDITVSRNNACGTGPAKSLYVNVNPIPINNGGITGLTNVCKGQNSITYTVPSITNADSYIWTLPNGAIGTSTSNTISVDYTYSASSGNITVKGRNICGTDGNVITIPVTVNSIPIPTANNNGPVCLGDTLLLSTPNMTGATYYWTGPNGFTSTVQNPMVSPNASIVMEGLYNITVTVNGCTSQPATTNVIINQASASSNSPICSNGNLSLSASTIPGASYFWTGPNGFSSTEQNPIINTNTTSAMAGVYSVYTTVNGCTSPTPGSTTIIINPLPTSPILSNNGPVCIGNQLFLTASTLLGATYSWAGPDGFTSTQQNPIVSSTATTAMSGLYNLIASVNGCSSNVASTNVEINKITASNNGPVCSGTTLSLNATSVTGALYSWTGPNGFTSTQQNPIVNNNSNSTMTGIYSVTSTVNGCTSQNSVTLVSVNSSPISPIITQVGNQLQSSSTNGNQWYSQNGIINGANNQNYTPTEGGNYYVILTVNNCSSTSMIYNYIFLSSEEFNSRNDIKIYPNPTHSKINIDCGSKSNLIGSVVKINNTLGQEIYKSILHQQITELSLNSSSGQGIYFVNIIDAQGHTIDVKKIILQ